MKVIIVGAGIVGASCAYYLANDGHDVIVVDAGHVGGRASADAFGWINASFAETPEYYQLRRAAIALFRKLGDEIALPSLKWRGAIWFEDEGAEFDAQLSQMNDYGYEVSLLDRAAFSTLEPQLNTPPARSILGTVEGAAQGDEIARALLGATNAQVLTGCRVTGVSAGHVSTDRGDLSADHVIVAAGAATTELVGLPMNNQRGVVMHTKPVGPVVNHIIMAPACHFRQAVDGRLIVGGSFSGGGFDDEKPQDISAAMLARMAEWLPGVTLTVDQLRFGVRPVPLDGLPAIGMWNGVYVAAMHSGISLGPLVGRLVAREIAGPSEPLLATFRPDRFA